MGTVVLEHPGGGYEVEFITLDGETVAVVSLNKDQLRSIGPARSLARVTSRRGRSELEVMTLIVRYEGDTAIGLTTLHASQR